MTKSIEEKENLNAEFRSRTIGTRIAFCETCQNEIPMPCFNGTMFQCEIVDHQKEGHIVKEVLIDSEAQADWAPGIKDVFPCAEEECEAPAIYFYDANGRRVPVCGYHYFDRPDLIDKMYPDRRMTDEEVKEEKGEIKRELAEEESHFAKEQKDRC